MRLKSSLPDLIIQKNTFTVYYHTTNKINKLVIGLNEIMSHSQPHDEVLKKIEEYVKPSKLGRPGMNLRSMFVLGTFRVVCNYSYAIPVLSHLNFFKKFIKIHQYYIMFSS